MTTEAGAKNFILEKKPDTVIHCAAYTAVDKAESEAELAITVNGLGTRWVAKACREVAVITVLDKYFVVRTSWVFGINGNNFIKTMLRLAETKKKLNVVNDQIGSPTYTPDLARLLADMTASEKFGIYHATNESFCSWADFVREIFKQAGLDVEVDGVPTIEYPTPARRPFNSRLSKKSLNEAGFDRLPPWEDALKRYLVELKQKSSKV